MPGNIGKIFHSICRTHGIKYTSIGDARRLGQLIKEVHGIIDEIYQILDRHNIKTNFKEVIEQDLLKIHDIDHDLIKLAKQLKEE
jgi:hypothetical protein